MVLKRHLAPVCTNDVKSWFVSDFREARLSLDPTLVCTARKNRIKKKDKTKQKKQQTTTRSITKCRLLSTGKSTYASGLSWLKQADYTCACWKRQTAPVAWAAKSERTIDRSNKKTNKQKETKKTKKKTNKTKQDRKTCKQTNMQTNKQMNKLTTNKHTHVRAQARTTTQKIWNPKIFFEKIQHLVTLGCQQFHWFTKEY